MKGNFTENARRSIEMAGHSAAELGHNYIGTEHLLLGLLKAGDTVASRALASQDVTEANVTEKIIAAIGTGEGGTPQDYTPKTKRVLELSSIEAERMRAGYIGTEHLLLALVRESDSLAVEILGSLNVNGQRLYQEILNMLGEGGQNAPSATQSGMSEMPGFGMFGNLNKKNQFKNAKGNTPVLDQFSRDFTAFAREDKFDPIIGREDEIQRIIQILSRRTKNNPCLVGDPGVGKTAIVEGLSQKIIEGNIPEILKGKRVVALDLSAMVAGSKYRGEFEERIKRVMNEVKNPANNVILFIDELHTIIGAGGAEGALDASNILKPALSRGEMQVIGATTLNEYRKYIEKDAALERRFQPVTVSEPIEDEAVRMLIGVRDKYEAHHNVVITNRAVEAAVRLSSRYINDRFLPDKAIDLIDEAASKVRLLTYTAPDNVKALEKEIADLDNEKEEAIKTEAFEKAGEIKNRQEQLKKALAQAKTDWQIKNTNETHTVDEEQIADVVGLWTGVPVKKLQQQESERLINMEEIIHRRLVSQNEAVSAVCRAIRRGRVGFKNPRRPVGSFLFLGPTGVGKTELSKALAEVLFGKDDAMIRVDMSEYMESHSVSKIIGSPPGYIGYDEGGQLSEKVRRKPYSVILFDEVEKAHPDVFNILLQVLDDGHITDAQGRKINFKNTVIIMTSNAGARNIISPKRLGFMSTDDEKRNYEDMKKSVMDEVKNIFKPEFLNRIDEIIVFHALDKDQINQIARLMTKELSDRIKESVGMELSVSEEALAHVREIGYDPAFGARPLLRAIQTNIEDPLAEKVLDGTFKEGDTIRVGLDGGKIVFN